MNATDLSHLNGRLVLVCASDDQRNPPTGRRGTLRVLDAVPGGKPVVQAEVEFPQMFTSVAHTRVITLSDEEVARLLGSEHEETYTVTVKGRLDPQLQPGNE